MIYLVAPGHLAEICASRCPIRGALAGSFSKQNALLVGVVERSKDRDSDNPRRISRHLEAQTSLYGCRDITIRAKIGAWSSFRSLLAVFWAFSTAEVTGCAVKLRWSFGLPGSLRAYPRRVGAHITSTDARAYGE